MSDPSLSATASPKLDQVVTVSLTDVSDPKVQKRLRTRYNLIRELVSTEESFARDLDIIISVYLRYASVHPYCEYLDPQDLSALFGNVSQIMNASVSFVANLKAWIPSYIIHECDLVPPSHALASSAASVVSTLTTATTKPLLKDVPSNVGIAVLEYLCTLERVFKTYCTQNETQMNTFYRIQKLGTPTVERWFVECSEQSRPLTQAWTLDSLLIKPVQRLLKYPLLLSSMLDNTPEDHPDYCSLQKAFKEMQECANRINNDAEMSPPASSITAASFTTSSLVPPPTATSPSRIPISDVASTSSENRSSTNSDNFQSDRSSPFTHTPPTPHSLTFSSNYHSPNAAAASNSTAHNLNASTTPHGSILPKPIQQDYNSMLLGLKDSHEADEDLSALLVTFHAKYGMIKNLIGAIQGNVAFIQNHFDVSSGLAQSWMNWTTLCDEEPTVKEELNNSINNKNLHRRSIVSAPKPIALNDSMDVMDDLLKKTKMNLKMYRRYAMFSLTFTTASSAHVSSNRLKQKADAEVIAPLAKVLGMFRNILALVEERKRLHIQFMKYLNYKVTHQVTGASAAAPSGLPAFTGFDMVANNTGSGISTASTNNTSTSTYTHSASDNILFRSADRFWRIHTRLKAELPQLFVLCEKMVDACLEKFISIQNDWFKTVLDATCNVCQLQPEDVARDVYLPVLSHNDGVTAASDDVEKHDLILDDFNYRVKADGVHKYVAQEFTQNVSRVTSAASPITPSFAITPTFSRQMSTPSIHVSNHHHQTTSLPASTSEILTSVASTASGLSLVSGMSDISRLSQISRNSQDLTTTSMSSNMSCSSVQSSSMTANTILSETPSYSNVSTSLSSDVSTPAVKQKLPMDHPMFQYSHVQHNYSNTAVEVVSAKTARELSAGNNIEVSESQKELENQHESEFEQEDESDLDESETTPTASKPELSENPVSGNTQVEKAIDAVLCELAGMSDSLETRGIEDMNNTLDIRDFAMESYLQSSPIERQAAHNISSIAEEEEGRERINHNAPVDPCYGDVDDDNQETDSDLSSQYSDESDHSDDCAVTTRDVEESEENDRADAVYTVDEERVDSTNFRELQLGTKGSMSGLSNKTSVGTFHYSQESDSFTKAHDSVTEVSQPLTEVYSNITPVSAVPPSSSHVNGTLASCNMPDQQAHISSKASESSSSLNTTLYNTSTYINNPHHSSSITGLPNSTKRYPYGHAGVIYPHPSTASINSTISVSSKDKAKRRKSILSTSFSKLGHKISGGTLNNSGNSSLFGFTPNVKLQQPKPESKPKSSQPSIHIYRKISSGNQLHGIREN